MTEEQIEKVISELRDKMISSNYCEVVHDYGVDYKRRDGNVIHIDNFHYNGKETITIKINHCESTRKGLNDFYSKKIREKINIRIIKDLISGTLK